MEDADDWRVGVTDADVDAARAALLQALYAGASKGRVDELILGWGRLVRAQDLQNGATDGGPDAGA